MRFNVRLSTLDLDLHPEMIARLIKSWVIALATTNLAWLQAVPETPSIYESGVSYRAEPTGREDFFDIPTVIDQGHADCEDLAAWLTAEYWAANQWADPIVTYDLYDNGDISFHVRVQTPHGLEDPSAMLGMP